MFKPYRIIFIALPLLMFCVPLVFLKTSSQSLPQSKLFADGVINTDADEYGPAFTSDGKTLYFIRRVNRRDSEFIFVSRLENGKWSAPELAPFSGRYFDKEPFVAPDGRRIFFASLRPVDGVEPKNRRDFNIWFVEKTASGWSEPKHAGHAVNSPAYENYPSVAANGTLYFGGEREGGRGGNDLYRARLVNGKYEQVESQWFEKRFSARVIQGIRLRFSPAPIMGSALRRTRLQVNRARLEPIKDQPSLRLPGDDDELIARGHREENQVI